MEIDMWLILGLFSFFVLLPAGVIFLELYNRSKYPIRAKVKIQYGQQGSGQKTEIKQDRLGYIDVTNDKGEKTGAKEWRLRSINRPVQNMQNEFVYEENIWFGFKKAKVAFISSGIAGEKGEEFFAMGMDEAGKSFKPIYDGDRGLMLYKIHTAIINRNKFANWFKQNMFEIIKIGMELIIIVMLFLMFTKIADMVDKMGAWTSSCAAVHNDFQQYYNQTNSTQAKQIQAGNIMGVPFGGG